MQRVVGSTRPKEKEKEKKTIPLVSAAVGFWPFFNSISSSSSRLDVKSYAVGDSASDIDTPACRLGKRKKKEKETVTVLRLEI